MRTRIALIVVVLGVLPLGCKTTGEDSEDVEPVITGEYTLVSIDGHPIPHAPRHGGQQVPTVASGTLTLREGGAFAAMMEYVDASGRTTNRGFTGTYAPEGAAFILKWQGAGTTSVVIEDDELTLNNEGMLFVFEK